MRRRLIAATAVAWLAPACRAPTKAAEADATLSSAPSSSGPGVQLQRVDVRAADAVMLLLTLSPDGVVVEDALRGPLSVDLDPSDGPDEAFRTRVFDAADTELYRRNSPTPVLVRDFLAHYSGLAGFDLLPAIPDLGAFHVLVPELPGAHRVVFEIRDPDGSYREVGTWDPARAPDAPAAAPESVTGWTTLHWSGDSDHRLDLVLVGDGYTAAEADAWAADAEAQAARILSTPPLDAFADRINIHRLDAVSAESGASYDCVEECRFRDVAFRSVFAVNFINDLTGTDYRSSTLFQLGQHELDRALATAPTDLALVVVNSEAYGGMSIHHATVSNGGTDWTDTGVHELGHLLGLLGDEYTADECIRSDAMGLPPNISASPTAPPWDHWIPSGTSLPTDIDGPHADRVGAFESAYNCPELYRPVASCKMKDSSGSPFCPVCTESLVFQITRHTDLSEVEVTPTADGAQVQVDTLGFGQTVTWSTDGTTFAPAAMPLTLRPEDGETVWLEVAVHLPQIRDPARAVVERIALQWEPQADSGAPAR